MRPSTTSILPAALLGLGLLANPLFSQSLADKSAYESQIAELEARVGIYGVELSEAYLGLGRTLRALDDHGAAADAFGKALQALRIGYGLNDLRQLPVLEELRTTQEQRGAWDELHSTHYLMLNIAQRSGDEELRVNALRELSSWIRRANSEGLVSTSDAKPSSLLSLLDGEIKRLEAKEDYEGRNFHLATLYLDLAATELSEAKRKYELPITAFETPGIGEQRSTITQNCFTGLDRSGRPITVCNQPVVVPNMNYFLAPNAQKSQEIRLHLLDAENTVLKAFHTLQGESDSSERKHALLAEVQRLTGEYNDFVEENRNQDTPLR